MKKLASSIISNIFTFLLSLALAILIWVNAQQTEDPLRSEFLTIPVNIIGQPEDSILLTPVPDRLAVQVVFEGPSSIVSEVTPNNFSASINLNSVPFGTETIVPVNVQTLSLIHISEPTRPY